MDAHSKWQWHLDEVFVKINGETHYLWREVDHEGEVLETFATKRRDRKAALKFSKKSMKRYGNGRDNGDPRRWAHPLSQGNQPRMTVMKGAVAKSKSALATGITWIE
jgi:hypothetical protein